MIKIAIKIKYKQPYDPFGRVADLRYYRADGLRIRQEDTAGSTDTYYDGQMPIYEVESSGENTCTLKINFLGTRGIESVTTIEQEYRNVV